MLKKILCATIAVIMTCSTGQAWADIFEAVKKSDVGAVKKYVAQGVDVNVKNQQGASPLHLAKNVSVAKLLINAGANVNAKVSGLGITPLQMAAMDGRTDIAKLLITAGADDPARC